jgi:hypothetical protein
VIDDPFPELVVLYDPLSSLLDEFEKITTPFVSVVVDVEAVLKVPLDWRLEEPDDVKLTMEDPVAVAPLLSEDDVALPPVVPWVELDEVVVFV